MVDKVICEGQLLLMAKRIKESQQELEEYLNKWGVNIKDKDLLKSQRKIVDIYLEKIVQKQRY